MAQRIGRILVIDPDPDMRDMLAQGILAASGQYDAIEAADGAEALSVMMSEPVDLIMMELEMPGFSGKDFMVALNSQGFETPIIVTTYEGGDALAIEAFRLGAKDYLTKPFREMEVLSAIERVLYEIRLRYERDHLTNSLQGVNQQLENRLSEERTLFAIGKSVTSLTNLDQLLNLIVEAAVYLTSAEVSGTLLSDDHSGALILRSGKNLPENLAAQMGNAVEDDLAALVLTSGEPFIASGDGLVRFNPPHDAHSVIYVPLMVGERAVGTLWVGNRDANYAFVDRQSDLLSALADYAAIAVVNARLFQVMDERARRLEQAYQQLKAQQTALSPERFMDFKTFVDESLSAIRNDLSLLRGEATMRELASLDVLDRRMGEMITWMTNLDAT